jgi:folate-binding protein YgfZ
MSPPAHNVPWIGQYEALVENAALVDLGHRTQIEISGADRATFLHNLTTNEVRKLAAGAGCEAFLTSVQGKTLAHVFVFVCPESLVLDTVPGEAETILKHLDHYLVSERVTLADRTGQWAETFLGGLAAHALLERLTGTSPPAARLAHAPATIAENRVWLRRADLAGPVGFLLSGPAADVAGASSTLRQAGAVDCGREAFEAARIECGFPLFGIDITAKNLPQEVARDELSISFTKGCYLGQETVARIDALGHVNRTLAGVRFAGDDVPPPGCDVSAAGTVVGQVTSAAWSPRLSSPLALAYLRRGANEPGVRLSSAVGEAEVIALPLDRAAP